jgi:molybdopterin converting factor small subunit
MADHITVRYRAQLAAFTGLTEEQFEAATVRDVLRHIREGFGAEAEKKAKTMLIVVNGESVLQLRHFKTALHGGDVVSFLPICGGG